MSVLILILALVGCQKRSASAAIKASCGNLQALSICTDYSEQAFALGEGFVKSACEATAGTWAEKPCAADGMLGTCTLEGGQLKRYYAGGTIGYTASSAGTDCRDLSAGSWAAN